MEKTIRICERDYKMKSSAYTQFAYRNETGRGLLSDLMELGKLNTDDGDIEAIDKLNSMVLQMAYVMVKEADKSQVDNFESFLKGIDDLYTTTDWVSEVVELATSPLSRGLFKKSEENK